MKKEVIKFENLTNFINYMKTHSGVWISSDDPQRRMLGYEKDNIRIEIGIRFVKDEIFDGASRETKLLQTWEGRRELGESYCKK